MPFRWTTQAESYDTVEGKGKRNHSTYFQHLKHSSSLSTKSSCLHHNCNIAKDKFHKVLHSSPHLPYNIMTPNYGPPKHLQQNGHSRQTQMPRPQAPQYQYPSQVQAPIPPVGQSSQAQKIPRPQAQNSGGRPVESTSCRRSPFDSEGEKAFYKI